jgi:hypothetical protein
VGSTICFGPFEPGEVRATKNRCTHTFHYECIQGQWAAAPVRACVFFHSADDRLGSTYEDNLHPAEGSDHVHRIPLDYQREHLRTRVQAPCTICFGPLPGLSMGVVNWHSKKKKGPWNRQYGIPFRQRQGHGQKIWHEGSHVRLAEGR